ncbi:MAG TPA: AAA family ATPase [Solirubrobacterales bacterium]|nr:AAA family ATPase [Solirubrobacterales bacterium]
MKNAGEPAVGDVRTLLEREAELAAIAAAVEATVGGAGRAVAIEGEAGVGKTSLLGAARGLAAEAGAEVLSARAGELEHDFPFAVLRQLLTPPLRWASASERESLFEGADAARRALGLPGADGSAADTFSVLHALYWVVAGLAEQGPLMLSIDDAQFADAASLDWLAFMLPRLGELPLCVMLARRTGEAESPSLARIVGDHGVEIVRPAPLTSAATATLIGAALSQEPDSAFATVCHEVTGGNPFLVTELGRELADQGIDPRAEQSESVRGLAPERVAQTVLARISHLPPEALTLARAVAILGDGCEAGVALKLAGIDREAGRQVADSLRKAAIFDHGDSLSFIHPLVRNAVYADIRAGERSAAHATAAALLRETGAAPERVADQLLAGEPREDAAAAETLLEAGRRALTDGAPRSAISYLARALREPPPADLRLEVLAGILTAGMRAADREALAMVEPELRAAIDRDPAGTRGVTIELFKAMVSSGRLDEAARLLPPAVQAAADEGDIENAFRMDSQLRTIGMVVSSAPKVDLERYLDQVEPDSPAGRLAAAIEARVAVIAESRPDAVEAAKRALGNGCSLFEEEPEMISAPTSVFVLMAADEVDAAAAAADRALEIARRRNSAPEMGRAWFVKGVIAWTYGDLVASEGHHRQAREIGILAGIPPLSFITAGPLAELMIQRDELDESEAILATMGVAGGPIPPSGIFMLLLTTRARLRCERGEYAECLEDVATVVGQSEEMGYGPGPALLLGIEEVRSLVALGRIEEARERSAVLLDFGRRWGVPMSVSYALRAAAPSAEGAAEIEMLREAVEVSSGSNRRLQVAEAHVDLGAALRRQNQRAAAREPLREGLKLARRCGSVRLARRAQQELQATGETVRRYAPVGVESLTPSERRTAEMAASGMTNRQIAQSLFVTMKTVEAHLSAAYDKLDIGSRRELPGALSGSQATD